MLVYFLKKNII